MDKLAAIETLAKIVSLIAIPVVLAVVGWLVQDKLATRTVSKDYVQLAVSILSQPKQSEIDPALRAWAVQLLNENSPVKFSKEVAGQLATGALSLPVEQAENLRALASSYAKTGDYPKAIAALEESLAIQEKEYGKDHPAVSISLVNLAALYEGMGRLLEARALYMRALETQERALGPEHPQVASTLSRLGHLYFSLGDYKKAIPILERALAIRERTLGPSDLEVAKSISDLASVYDSMGESQKALVLRQRADALFRDNLPPKK